MTKKFDIKKFNRLLAEHNQQLRAIEITGKKVVLSNGIVLDDAKEVHRCKWRIMTGDDLWKEYFDRIYSGDANQKIIAEKECKAAMSRRGGITCQRLHGEKIKSNLNTGIPWNKDTKGQYPYSHPCTEAAKIKIGNANRGEKNGMFGKKHSVETKRNHSKHIKNLILSGKFTPNSNNRNTHWDSFYKDKKYRSSWEALYQYFDNDAEYETLRIPYCFNSKDYIYIVDFVNHNTKTVVEVKPRELINDIRTQAKISAATNWCNINGYTFVLVDKNYLKSKSMPTDLTEFDLSTQEKIRKLYETS